jgi:hypothetical protein
MDLLYLSSPQIPYVSVLKRSLRGARWGICWGVGCAHTPTYTGPPLAVALFSVDSYVVNSIAGYRILFLAWGRTCLSYQWMGFLSNHNEVKVEGLHALVHTLLP